MSRLKINTGVYDLQGRPLDLAALLRAQGWIDQEVLLGAKERLRVRLVALKVPEAEANRRRRVARANHHFKASQKHLFLLGWNLFVTNLKRRECPAKAGAEVYRLRWRVEVHFKAWKQYFHLEDMPAGSALQVQVLLYARLLFISLFEVFYLAWWECRLQAQARSPVSLLKLAEVISLCIFIDFFQRFQSDLQGALEKQIAYHCVYEKRKRSNFFDMLYNSPKLS